MQELEGRLLVYNVIVIEHGRERAGVVWVGGGGGGVGLMALGFHQASIDLLEAG